MERTKTTNILLFILTSLLVAVVLKLAESVIVPILVSFLLSYIMDILTRGLRRLKVPHVAAVLITSLVFLGLLTGLVFTIYRGVKNFAERFPSYQERLSLFLTDAVTKLESFFATSLLQLDFAQEIEKLSIPSYALSFAQSIISSVVVFFVISIFASLIVYGKFYVPRKLFKAFPDKKKRRGHCCLHWYYHPVHQ